MRFIFIAIFVISYFSPLHAASNLNTFTKSQEATQSVKGVFGPYCFWYSPKWKFSKDFSTENKQDLVFSLEDCFWGTFRAQKIEKNNETSEDLRKSFLDSVGKFVSNITVQKEEERVVNGAKLKYFQFAGKTAGPEIVMDAYFYVGDSYTATVSVSSFKEFYSLFEKQILDFLNGFVPQDCQ